MNRNELAIFERNTDEALAELRADLIRQAQAGERDEATTVTRRVKIRTANVPADGMKASDAFREDAPIPQDVLDTLAWLDTKEAVADRLRTVLASLEAFCDSVAPSRKQS